MNWCSRHDVTRCKIPRADSFTSTLYCGCCKHTIVPYFNIMGSLKYSSGAMGRWAWCSWGKVEEGMRWEKLKGAAGVLSSSRASSLICHFAAGRELRCSTVNGGVCGQMAVRCQDLWFVEPRDPLGIFSEVCELHIHMGHSCVLKTTWDERWPSLKFLLLLFLCFVARFLFMFGNIWHQCWKMFASGATPKCSMTM